MKIFLARIALVVASFALVLLAAEGVARVIISRRPPPMPPRIPKEWQELPRIKSVHALSQPNVRALHARVLFETNSAGFRGPDRTPQKPPGVFRIVVIGDSVAMGWGVLYDHTYAARLERALNARPGSQTVQVLDIALAGLNTYTAVGRLISVGLSYEPDLVIYGFTLNDIENKHYRRSVDVDSRLLSETYESPSRLWRLIGRRGISLWYAIFAPRGSYVYECEDNYFDNPAAWELMLGHLNALAEVTGKHDLCTVLLARIIHEP